MKYITLIESFYPSLTKSEKKVADYIIDQKDQVLYQSLSDMANHIQVGEATIVRFCYKLGFEGVQDLKFSISREDDLFKNQTYDNYIDTIESNIQKVVHETKLVLDPQSLTQVIDCLYQCEQVYLFGSGASGLATLEAESRLLRIGKITKSVIDSHYQLMHAALCTSKTCVIAISLSGSTIETVEAAQIAKENGAKVIVLTNYIQSPLAKIADLILLTAGKENPLDGGSLVAKISQLYVIDLICTGYALKQKKKAQNAKELTARATLGRVVSPIKRNKKDDI